MPDAGARVARLRVPLGFALGAVALLLARPTWKSLAWGLPLAVAGEMLRVWASGHLEKNREVTASGPYRWTGHPLYAGSALMGVGLAVASASPAVWAITAVYLVVGFGSAIRTEQSYLAEHFADQYRSYRKGAAATAMRTFSLERSLRNREYRAVLGLLLAMGLLSLKAALS
ncbi:MAG: isoprenylcysteine carboxylmethyltransferase family protein [Vicinamibacterales bacterium]